MTQIYEANLKGADALDTMMGGPPEILISSMTQRVIICDQNELENNFIKSESLFDPFLAPKRHYFDFLAYFGLFYSGFAFRF